MPDYQSIVSAYIEKLKKQLPHRYGQFKETLQSFQGQGNNCFGNHILAFKLGVNLKQSKLKELALQTLITLVSKGYIDGTLFDTSFSYNSNELTEIAQTLDKQKNHPVNIIESLIHIASNCVVDKEEIIQLALKLLASIFTSPNCAIQSHEIIKIIRMIVYVYGQSKINGVDRYCKSILLQIIAGIFQGANCQEIVAVSLQGILNNVSQEKVCVQCFKEGKFECRINKVIVCSYQCKKLFSESIELKQRNYEITQFVFDNLLRLLPSKQQLQQSKNQQIVLEGLYFICDNYYYSLNGKLIVQICSNLLKFCLENDPLLYQLGFKIFQRLIFIKHRDMINQINIFINQIYINVLTSKNTTDQHKQTTLKSLLKIFQRKHAALEFYLNFDCSIKHEFLMMIIIDTLYQIFQQNEQYRILITQIYQTIINGIEYTYVEQMGKISHQEENRQEMQQHNDETVIINQLEMQRQLKQEIQKGIELFKKNPIKGINSLIGAGILTDDPRQIARFLLENNNLSKESVGQYIGDHHDLNIKVLSAYVDMLKFENLTVEQALRFYLDLFTLPPESQQIDRVVMKFADKYYEDNLNNSNILFKSSSSIYTFTYLLVMLQTDLHNPKVTDKMKLTDFIKLARGMNEGEDLPPEYLTSTYQSIQKTPLAFREQTLQPLGGQAQYQKEMEELVNKVKELIRRKPDTNYIQIDYESVLLSKSFIEAKYGKVLEVYLIIFESPSIGDSIIKSILLVIKLCCKLQINIDQALQSVIKVSLTSVNRRNNMLIIGLLSIISQIGNSLHETGWKQILDLISYLDEVRIIDQDHTEKVFLTSKDLDNSSIEEFIVALCQVSKQEIYQKQRIYALQKLVEVSDYNMDRVKLIWNRLWAIVSSHITEVAIKEKKITMFAVDSLKQLNIKFLQKEELYNIQFQREVLKPFELIFTSSDVDVKEFILSCVKQILQHHKTNIKSGWKVIFSLINQGLKEENEKISNLAFELLSIIEINEKLLVDLIQTLAVLGRKENLLMALTSIELVKRSLEFMQKEESQALWFPLLGILSNLVGDKRMQVQTSAVETLFQILEQFGYQFNEEYWKMIFTSVLRPIFDEIQFTLSANPDLNQYWFKDSCQKVFQNITNLFKNHYSKLKSQLPEILRLFQSCIQNQNEKLATLSIQAFKIMIMDRGVQFEKQDWDQVVQFIAQMLKQTIPTQLYNISNPNSSKNLGEQSTQLKVQRQKSMKTIIHSLLSECYSQCASQLLLIQISKDIIESFYENLQLDQLDILESIFQESFQFAKQFNQQIEQRYLIWRQGFMADMNVLPGLLRQEREAFVCVLTIKQYKLKLIDSEKSDQYELVLQSYMNILIDSIKNFNVRHEQFIKTTREIGDDPVAKLKQSEAEREIQNLKTLLDSSILPKILALSDDQLKLSLNDLFELLLTACSYANDYSISQITCPSCKECSRCLQQKNTLFQQIRKCLTRLFELK